MLQELRKINSYNAWVVVFAAVGTIASAYGLAIIGSTVGEPGFYDYFGLAAEGEPGYDHTTNMVGALNGVNSAGNIAGAILQSWTADLFGRKRTIQFGSVVLVIGGALCAGSVHMAMFLVGRFIAGMGSGILTCIVPIYQAEISTAETRGAMVAITGVMYSMGIQSCRLAGLRLLSHALQQPYRLILLALPASRAGSISSCRFGR